MIIYHHCLPLFFKIATSNPAEDRQRLLRERARQLISEARAGVGKPEVKNINDIVADTTRRTGGTEIYKLGFEMYKKR